MVNQKLEKDHTNLITMVSSSEEEEDCDGKGTQEALNADTVLLLAYEKNTQVFTFFCYSVHKCIELFCYML